MKIISQFKDYYDGMRCYAICSDDFTYIRKQEVLSLDGFHNSFSFCRKGEEYNYEINKFIVGFCGKYYLGFSVKKIDSFAPDKIINYFYDQSMINKYLTKKARKRRKKSKIRKKYRTSYIFLGKTLEEHFKEDTEKLKKFDLFNKHDTPYFILSDQLGYEKYKVCHTDNLVINPRLEDFNFFKIFEGYYAYQEIEMYLSNQLLNKNNAPQITNDLVKIRKHGFDIKKSFRKEKTKKR